MTDYRSGRQGRDTYSKSAATPIPTTTSTKDVVTDLGMIIKGYKGWTNQGARLMGQQNYPDNSTMGINLYNLRKQAKNTPDQWFTYYGDSSGIYGKRTDRVTVVDKIAGLKENKTREELLIEKNREGKQELVDEANKPLQVTAEDILKKRLALIRFKGRASMPSSSASKDEPTVNISSGGAIGLNFA